MFVVRGSDVGELYGQRQRGRERHAPDAENRHHDVPVRQDGFRPQRVADEYQPGGKRSEENWLYPRPYSHRVVFNDAKQEPEVPIGVLTRHMHKQEQRVWKHKSVVNTAKKAMPISLVPSRTKIDSIRTNIQKSILYLHNAKRPVRLETPHNPKEMLAEHGFVENVDHCTDHCALWYLLIITSPGVT